MKCPKCSAEGGSGRFCRSCGVQLAPPAQSACRACGTTSVPGSKFCSNCAAPLGSASAPPPAPIMICVHCGSALKPDGTVCQACGQSVVSGATPTSPDELPTAMMPSPAPGSQAIPEGNQLPPRAAVVHPTSLKGIPRSEPAAIATPAGGKAPSSGKTPLLVGIVLVALVAASIVYKFVLHKQIAQAPAVAEAPASAQPASAAPLPSTPETSSQTPAGTETQSATDGSGSQAITPAEGNGSPAVVGTTPAHAKRSPSKAVGPAYAQAHANAEQALAAAQYLDPPDASALFWARKAKALGDPGAAQIEQQIFAKGMADVASARQGHGYDQAQSQLYQLSSNFPEHTELKQMQDDIRQEQQHYTQQMEEQRRQAELLAQTKKFAVQHRHGTGSNFCNGLITVTPDGVAKYDCTTADSGGRCEHVTFAPGSLKEVKLKGDGSLHLATRQQGNFDFSGGDFAMKDAAAALSPLVKR